MVPISAITVKSEPAGKDGTNNPLMSAEKSTPTANIVTTNTLLMMSTKTISTGSNSLYPLVPSNTAAARPKATAQLAADKSVIDCKPSAAPDIFPAS